MFPFCERECMMDEWFPDFTNLSSVILELQDSLLNGWYVYLTHFASTFLLVSIRTCISMCRQLYRNSTSTFGKLERCQQQFGRLSWSGTVQLSFIRVWVWICRPCPTSSVWNPSNSFKCCLSSQLGVVTVKLILAEFFSNNFSAHSNSDGWVQQQFQSSDLSILHLAFISIHHY